MAILAKAGSNLQRASHWGGFVFSYLRILN
jgi:hypothetical protein